VVSGPDSPQQAFVDPDEIQALIRQRRLCVAKVSAPHANEPVHKIGSGTALEQPPVHDQLRHGQTPSMVAYAFRTIVALTADEILAKFAGSNQRQATRPQQRAVTKSGSRDIGGGCSITCTMAPGVLSPSSGSEF
jgi:hypothetical protein